MKISNLGIIIRIKPDMEDAKNIYKQVPISQEDGSPNFSFRVFTIEPGGHTPLHNHPFEHLNYILEGRGILFCDDREHPVKKGDFVLVLPDETHQYSNASDSEDMVFICAVPKEYE